MKSLANSAVLARVAHPVAWRLATAARAWRAITPGEWIAAGTIGLFYYLLLVVSLLQNVLGLAANVGGMNAWNAQSLIGLAAMCLVGAYCFLFAVRIAEFGVPGGIASKWRYVFAAVVAVAVDVPVLVSIAYVLGPPCSCDTDPFRSAMASGIFFASDLALTGGLALGVYLKLKSARAAREAFHAAELQRLAIDREVLASRVAVMRARVEPEFLLSTLAQVERLYDRASPAAASMLDSLIAYLRTALPQLREESSTLGREVQLASSYLDVIRARMGSRLHYTFDIPAELATEQFPALVLLPLVEDALINGIEPLPHGGKIDVRARTGEGYLLVSVLDDGLWREPNEAMTALEARLRATYGEDARMIREPNSPHGVFATVEVPRAASNYR